MRGELLLILPILAAIISGLTFGAVNSVMAQNMTGNETLMMTNMTNATMGGNVIGEMSNAASMMMTNSS
jgi:hypothetical protein